MVGGILERMLQLQDNNIIFKNIKFKMRECYACGSSDTYKRLGKYEIWFPNKGTHFVSY